MIIIFLIIIFLNCIMQFDGRDCSVTSFFGKITFLMHNFVYLKFNLGKTDELNTFYDLI